VDRVNKTLAQVEQIKKFTIIPKKLYEEDGEVRVRKEDLRGNRREIKRKAAEKALEFFYERLVRNVRFKSKDSGGGKHERKSLKGRSF